MMGRLRYDGWALALSTARYRLDLGRESEAKEGKKEREMVDSLFYDRCCFAYRLSKCQIRFLGRLSRIFFPSDGATLLLDVAMRRLGLFPYSLCPPPLCLNSGQFVCVCAYVFLSGLVSRVETTAFLMLSDEPRPEEGWPYFDSTLSLLVNI
jgi:hypothetical protein